MPGFRISERFRSMFELRKITQILKRGEVFKKNDKERRRNKFQVPKWR
jgi:hypothetical protein